MEHRKYCGGNKRTRVPGEAEIRMKGICMNAGRKRACIHASEGWVVKPGQQQAAAAPVDGARGQGRGEGRRRNRQRGERLSVRHLFLRAFIYLVLLVLIVLIRLLLEATSQGRDGRSVQHTSGNTGKRGDAGCGVGVQLPGDKRGVGGDGKQRRWWVGSDGSDQSSDRQPPSLPLSSIRLHRLSEGIPTQEVIGSSEELCCGDLETSEGQECGSRLADQELKEMLLKKYSGYLSNLRKEFLKKRKKGKLPKDARLMLLDWWNTHYRWPYPTVISYRVLHPIKLMFSASLLLAQGDSLCMVDYDVMRINLLGMVCAGRGEGKASRENRP
ncbi:hypothetical protein B296_00036850 [Ensete ventricosum]|uniref:ELK domain-containing protein n=1 Tax=Ensete ventricosum TaxID=4639 RepID=A0A426XMA1_ENSVE|nr:hypothetical protein B296_00036850 [Ensete ventricosum]